MTKGEWIVYDSCIAQYLGVDGIVFYPFILIAKNNVTRNHRIKT